MLLQFLNGVEGLHPQKRLLRRADEPFGTTVASRAGAEAGELSMPR
jgi:hypothetical protein